MTKVLIKKRQQYPSSKRTLKMESQDSRKRGRSWSTKALSGRKPTPGAPIRPNQAVRAEAWCVQLQFPHWLRGL